MERTMNQAAGDAMAEAVLNPEFQAALDEFEPDLDAPLDNSEAAESETFDEDPDFAALAEEVEAAAVEANFPAPHAAAIADASGSHAAAMKISPFALLMNPAQAFAAAKRLESLPLPRRVVFLFGKKGVTSNPEISRLDQDMDLEAEDELDDEAAEALTEQ